MLLEVCVDDLEGLDAATAGGADRIELCSALAIGGLTPTIGLMQEAGRRDIPVYAMIRPRAGGFVFTKAEIALMKTEIDAARQAGLAGVVLGASLPGGRLDEEGLRQLCSHAEGLGLTLHRAFDLVPNIADAVEMAVRLGFERILTSGQAMKAIDGRAALAEAVEVAADRISIMPGSGVTAENVGAICDGLPIREVHASCSAAEPIGDPRLEVFGFAIKGARRPNTALVAALKASALEIACGQKRNRHE